MFKLLVLYRCIYIFKICLIFKNIDAGDVFVVIFPLGNDEHVAYFLIGVHKSKAGWFGPMSMGISCAKLVT